MQARSPLNARRLGSPDPSPPLPRRRRSAHPLRQLAEAFLSLLAARFRRRLLCVGCEEYSSPVPAPLGSAPCPRVDNADADADAEGRPRTTLPLPPSAPSSPSPPPSPAPPLLILLARHRRRRRRRRRRCRCLHASSSSPSPLPLSPEPKPTPCPYRCRPLARIPDVAASRARGFLSRPQTLLVVCPMYEWLTFSTVFRVTPSYLPLGVV